MESRSSRINGSGILRLTPFELWESLDLSYKSSYPKISEFVPIVFSFLIASK